MRPPCRRAPATTKGSREGLRNLMVPGSGPAGWSRGSPQWCPWLPHRTALAAPAALSEEAGGRKAVIAHGVAEGGPFHFKHGGGCEE